MSDPTAQEPTMEEILASIRRIISEDDQPAAAAAPAPAPAPVHQEPAPVAVHAPEPVHEPEPIHTHHEEEDDVLELNEPAPAFRETHGDLDVFDAPRPIETRPEPKVEMAPIKMADPEPTPRYSALADLDIGEPSGLTSGRTASAAASHFGALAQSVAMPAAGRTLEDVVGELLRPLLKDWLDQHLPAMVEQAVRDEVERISRRRVY